MLPSPQGPGLETGSPAPGSQYPCFHVSLRPEGGPGVIRGCSEEAGLPHRAPVFAQISPLAGPRVGFCYPRYSRCTSLCFPAPVKRVWGGARRGSGWGLARAAIERAEAAGTGCPGKPVGSHPLSPSDCNGGTLCCFRVAIAIPPGESNTERLPPLDRQRDK